MRTNRLSACRPFTWLHGFWEKKKAAWIGLWAGVRKPKFACSLMSGRGQARNRFAYARVYTYICSVYYVTTSSGGAGRRIWTTWRTDLLCSAVLYQTIYAETKTFPLYKQTDLWQSSLHIVCTWRLSCRQVWVFGKTICVGGGGNQHHFEWNMYMYIQKTNPRTQDKQV